MKIPALPTQMVLKPTLLKVPPARLIPKTTTLAQRCTGRMAMSSPLLLLWALPTAVNPLKDIKDQKDNILKIGFGDVYIG